MKEFSITDLITVFISLISVVSGYFIGSRQIKTPTNIEISKKLVNEVFIPYHFLIELELYKHINKHSLKKKIILLQEFKSYIEANNLRFYFSNRFLYSLDNMTLYNPNKTYNFYRRLRFNDYYRLFSLDYLKALNKSRKVLGLEKRNLDYRIYNNLFAFPLLLRFFLYAFLFMSIGYFLMLIYINI